jgi:hypothetical protein
MLTNPIAMIKLILRFIEKEILGEIFLRFCLLERLDFTLLQQGFLKKMKQIFPIKNEKLKPLKGSL